MARLGYADLAAKAKQSGYGNEPLPKGEYSAVVTGAKFGQSKGGDNPGSDQFTVEFTVTEKGDLKGRKAWLYLTKTEKAIGMYFQRLAILGIDDAYLADIDDDDEGDAIVCADLIDAECTLVCDVPREYNGTPRTQIKNIKPLSERAPARASTPDDDDEPPRARAARPRNPVAVEEETSYDDDEDDEPTKRTTSRRRSASRGTDGLPPGV